MKITIISSSLNKKSRSLILGKYAHELILNQNIECILIDLKEYDLPFCGEEGDSQNKNVQYINNQIATSDVIITSGPIYNYSVNAALKNVMDLTGKAWDEKVVAFMCMAGGQSSYMSIMGFANGLMLNSRCLIVPRFVYARPKSFDEINLKITDESLKERIKELCGKAIQLAAALKS